MARFDGDYLSLNAPDLLARPPPSSNAKHDVIDQV
jgi:hypothetical protein